MQSSRLLQQQRINRQNLIFNIIFMSYFKKQSQIKYSKIISYQKYQNNQKQQMGFFQQSLLFIGLSAGIYSCYLTSAIYHEKLLKNQYRNSQTGEKGYFGQSLIFTMFPPFFATIIGQIIMFINRQESKLPWNKCITISGIISLNMFTYNQAVIYASFPAVVMAKSCSLLSVIIVGVFFSRVKDSKLKLTNQKFLIGIVATLGIILFNLFKKQEKSTVDHAITLFSLGNLYLMISLIGDGFLPDFQAELKALYKPSTIDMYCKINRFTFLISLTLAIISGSIVRIYDFCMNYEDFVKDICKLSILNAIGQLFIYRMIKQFRQHIPAFVIAFRKCLTVVVNILWFHHNINIQQLFGLLFVFFAVVWEVYSNYEESVKKQQEKAAEYTVTETQQNLQRREQDANRLMKQLDQQIHNNEQGGDVKDAERQRLQKQPRKGSSQQLNILDSDIINNLAAVGSQIIRSPVNENQTIQYRNQEII